MFDVLYAELMKLRGTKILLLIPLGGLLPVLLMLGNFTDRNFHQTQFFFYQWEYFFDTALYYACGITGSAFVSIFAGYIFATEYQHKTVNTLFTYPFSRFKFFICKLFMIILFSACVFLASLLFMIGIGFFLDHDLLTIGTILLYGKYYLIMSLVCLITVPLAVFAALVGKSLVAPTVLGLISMLFFAIINTPVVNTIIPAAFPSLIWHKLAYPLGYGHPVFTWLSENMNNTNYSTAYIINGVIFAVMMSVCAIYYRYSETN